MWNVAITMLSLLQWTLGVILRWPVIFWSCVVINVLGAVVGGLLWYGPMLWTSPVWALPFIPDCPLAALVASIVLVGLRANKHWPVFTAGVAFACMKYGAWVMTFWLRQWSNTGAIEPIELLLFVSHIGLLIEGLLFVPRIGSLSMLKRLAVISWFVLSIGVDYGLGFHPPLASHVSVSFVFWTATILTGLLGMGLLALPSTRARPTRRAVTV